MDNSDVYLRAMMSLIARQTFSPEELRKLVSSRGTTKLLKAFNMCDGTKTQSEIAAELKIDAGQFSRSIKQWVDEGIVIKTGENRSTRIVHVYPIPDKLLKSPSGKAD